MMFCQSNIFLVSMAFFVFIQFLSVSTSRNCTGLVCNTLDSNVYCIGDVNCDYSTISDCIDIVTFSAGSKTIYLVGEENTTVSINEDIELYSSHGAPSQEEANRIEPYPGHVIEWWTDTNDLINIAATWWKISNGEGDLTLYHLSGSGNEIVSYDAVGGGIEIGPLTMESRRPDGDIDRALKLEISPTTENVTVNGVHFKSNSYGPYGYDTLIQVRNIEVGYLDPSSYGDGYRRFTIKNCYVESQSYVEEFVQIDDYTQWGTIESNYILYDNVFSIRALDIYGPTKLLVTNNVFEIVVGAADGDEMIIHRGRAGRPESFQVDQYTIFSHNLVIQHEGTYSQDLLYTQCPGDLTGEKICNYMNITNNIFDLQFDGDSDKIYDLSSTHSDENVYVHMSHNILTGMQSDKWRDSDAQSERYLGTFTNNYDISSVMNYYGLGDDDESSKPFPYYQILEEYAGLHQAVPTTDYLFRQRKSEVRSIGPFEYLCDTMCDYPRGLCIAEETCLCLDEEYFYDEVFEECISAVRECYGYNYTETEFVCGGHGQCVALDECLCVGESWGGDNCSTPVCFSYYSDHQTCGGLESGTCIEPDVCECVDPFFGDQCFEVISSAFFYDEDARNEIMVEWFFLTKEFSESELRDDFEYELLGSTDSFPCSRVLYNHDEFFFDSDDDEFCRFEYLSFPGNIIMSKYLVIGSSEDLEVGFFSENVTLEIMPISDTDFDLNPEPVIFKFAGNVFLEDDGGASNDNDDPVPFYYNLIYTMGGLVILVPFIGCCCVCLVFYICSMVCCFLFWGSCCCCCGSTIVLSQMKQLKKFKKLEDFDLLLKEQESVKGRPTNVAHLKIDKSLFEIQFDEIETTSVLGEGGSQSVVFKASWQNQVVAFKCFKTYNLCKTQNDFDEFEREVGILSSLSHPNIIRFFGATLKPPRVGIVMEYCENGEILDFLKEYRHKHNGKSYPINEKIRLISGIIGALSYCHSRSIIHRDLKCENVLIDGSESPKVMDFGLSKVVDTITTPQQMTKSVGTSIYMAPEVVSEDKYDSKCDVFSFAIMLWVIITENDKPYGENEYRTEFKVASNPNFRPDINALRSKLGNEKSMKWIHFVCKRCWSSHPEYRLSFERIADLFSKNLDDMDHSKNEVYEEDEDEEEDVEYYDDDDSSMSTMFRKNDPQSLLNEMKENEDLRKEVNDLKKELEEQKMTIFGLKERNKRYKRKAKKKEKEDVGGQGGRTKGRTGKSRRPPRRPPKN